MTTQQLWDVVIVGAGCAGLSAALILARARRRVLVLDGEEPRNRFAPHMHGVLSRDGYSPLDLVADGRCEVTAADGVIQSAQVDSLSGSFDAGFELITSAGERIHAARVIVATGIRDRLPAIAGLAEHWGRGAVACPYCDGYEARDSRIGVLLGSTVALHKAHLLRAYSPHITVFTALAGELSADEKRALAAQGIQVDGRAVASISSEGAELTGVTLTDGSQVALDSLFVDPAMEPLDELLRQLNAERTATPFGEWTTTDASFQSSVRGVYAVGNIANPAALVPIAMASGVAAATAINAELVAEDVATAVQEYAS